MPGENTAAKENANVRRDGDVVLRDGSTVHIRVMRASDEAGLCALLTSLSEESRWLRFYCLQNSAGLAAEAHREANLDQAFGLVACSGDEERVVGHAFYAALDEQRAEVAMVEDIPQIAELDCNPFVVHPTGATILDARIRVATVAPPPLVGVRR